MLRRFFIAEAIVTPWPFLSICALIALVGGGVKTLVQRNELTTWRDIVTGGLVSAFVGFGVGSLLLYQLGANKSLLIFPIVSVCGWIGVPLLDMAAALLLRRVKQASDKQASDEKRGN